MDKPKTRGGKREGAGRPPQPSYLRKRKLTIEIAPDLYEWIKTQPRGSAEKILQAAHIQALIV